MYSMYSEKELYHGRKKNISFSIWYALGSGMEENTFILNGNL